GQSALDATQARAQRKTASAATWGCRNAPTTTATTRLAAILPQIPGQVGTEGSWSLARLFDSSGGNSSPRWFCPRLSPAAMTILDLWRHDHEQRARFGKICVRLRAVAGQRDDRHLLHASKQIEAGDRGVQPTAGLG